MPETIDERFTHDVYLLRRKVLKLFGGAFHVFDEAGELLFYSKLKAFRLKEDIRIWTDESCTAEALIIRARNVIDFSAAYEVVDPVINQRIGVLRRKGFKSLLRDEWQVLDADEQLIGTLKEDSALSALVRRLHDGAALLFPQKYHLTADGKQVATFKQNFNPFVMKVTADFSEDTDLQLDRRLGIAAGLMLCAIEGKQD